MDTPARTDRIRLEGMDFYAHHGVNPQEREMGQRFRVDLEVEVDLRRAGASDDLRDTVDYSSLYRVAQEVMAGAPHNLLESLAAAIAHRVLDAFPVESARVRVEKVAPPVRGAILKGVWVEVHRRRQDIVPGRAP